MMTMQAHLQTMTTLELREFKRRITPNTTQIFVTALKNAKTTIDSLSRETSPRTDQTITETSPSRETGPHSTKSLKKLAQALKKRAKYDDEQKTHISSPDHSRRVLAAAPKHTARTPRPNPSIKTLADALKQHVERKSEQPTHTYAERIRELIGPPEQCKECGGEHPTRLCMKRFEKLRNPETTPLPMTDDDSTNSDTLCDSKESEDDETEPVDNLVKDMKRLSLTRDKSVTFNLPEDNSGTTLHDYDYSASDHSDSTEEPTSQNDEVDARLAHTAWLRKTSENVYMSNQKSMILKAYVHAAHRRTEAPALLDSGATENFMS